MVKVNDNYLKLPGSYLFSTIGRKVNAYSAANPDRKIIRLGIGDVTQPLSPAVISALHGAVDEMADAETFRGYAPDLGYEFLRTAIAENDYKAKGCQIEADEIFVSDGAKCDSGNIQEIFALDNKIAVCDPVYPVYVDTNVMAGRTGTYDAASGNWSDVIYMPCTQENDFVPQLPKKVPDLIYLCFPNNPTGSAISRAQLQEWVDYANRNGAVIIYDAAYEAYISEPDVPHTIYECEGARTCAIELRSFSKNAGFTGVRLGFTVIPKELKAGDAALHALWACGAVIDSPIMVRGMEYKMTCVSMGNPHAVVFVEDVSDLKIEEIGPYFERHERFPKRINTEFVKVLDRQNVQMRVWERGTGETLACGTGCCATAVACILNGLTDETVTVKLLGGEIRVTWDRQSNLVYMTGPAETVFEGEW